MTHLKRRLVLLFIVLIFVACGSDTELSGELLEGPEGASLCLAQDGDVVVRAWFQECRECTSIEQPSCSLSRDGDVVVVSSSSTRLEDVQEAVACTTGCVDVLVECGTVAAPMGDLEIRHGDEVFLVGVPIPASDRDVSPCAEDVVLPDPQGRR